MNICSKCGADLSPCWKKRPYCLYTEYCDPSELEFANPKLYKLIIQHGVMFDDYWSYRIAGRTRKVIVREPLWLGRIEAGDFAEKYRMRADPKQKKLVECLHHAS